MRKSTVVACIEVPGGYDVELDQTVFFPTGGGQPHDTGRISGIAVRDVREEDESVLHRTAAPLNVGSDVDLEIDWLRRLDHMQQHSGEHLLSFAAKELFQATNVGFHMAPSYCTVDFDVSLTPEDIRRLELRTNELIWANLPVELRYVTVEELDCMQLRKRASGLTGEVRIVLMPGGDSCTCCGTHVAHTGEVGALKVTAFEHYKGGERLTFACGGRALTHAQQMQDIADSLARSFSCKAEDAVAAVEKLQQELSATRRESKTLYAKLNQYLTAELNSAAREVKGVRLLSRLLPDTPAVQLRPLALKLCESGPMLVLLCAPAGDTAQYVLCCSKGVKLDMGDLIQAVNAATGGRGGGRGTLAQGSAKYTPALLDTFVQLEHYLAQRLTAYK